MREESLETQKKTERDKMDRRVPLNQERDEKIGEIK